jgi:hypothetical protein
MICAGRIRRPIYGANRSARAGDVGADDDCTLGSDGKSCEWHEATRGAGDRVGNGLKPLLGTAFGVYARG